MGKQKQPYLRGRCVYMEEHVCLCVWVCVIYLQWCLYGQSVCMCGCVWTIWINNAGTDTWMDHRVIAVGAARRWLLLWCWAKVKYLPLQVDRMVVVVVVVPLLLYWLLRMAVGRGEGGLVISTCCWCSCNLWWNTSTSLTNRFLFSSERWRQWVEVVDMVDNDDDEHVTVEDEDKGGRSSFRGT